MGDLRLQKPPSQDLPSDPLSPPRQHRGAQRQEQPRAAGGSRPAPCQCPGAGAQPRGRPGQPAAAGMCVSTPVPSAGAPQTSCPAHLALPCVSPPPCAGLSGHTHPPSWAGAGAPRPHTAGVLPAASEHARGHLSLGPTRWPPHSAEALPMAVMRSLGPPCHITARSPLSLS